MGSFSLVHWLVVLIVVLVLFGRGRISEIMGDFGKGIKSFKQGIADETTERPVTPPPAQIPPQVVQQTPPPVQSTAPQPAPAPQPTLNGDTPVGGGQN